MKRILVLVSVVALMVVMTLTMAMPAFAGNAYARGQDNSNPGFTQNQDTGDAKNEACEVNSPDTDRGCDVHPRTGEDHNQKGQPHGIWNN
jgi:hypothetical protein